MTGEDGGRCWQRPQGTLALYMHSESEGMRMSTGGLLGSSVDLVSTNLNSEQSHARRSNGRLVSWIGTNWLRRELRARQSRFLQGTAPSGFNTTHRWTTATPYMGSNCIDERPLPRTAALDRKAHSAARYRAYRRCSWLRIAPFNLICGVPESVDALT